MNTPAPLHYETAQALTRADKETYTTVNIPIDKRHIESLLRGMGWKETQPGYWRCEDATVVHLESSINLQRSVEIVLLAIAIANAG